MKKDLREVDFSTVPVEYMAEHVQKYYEEGCRPGSFLYALLTNNLSRAVGSADASNKQCLILWVYWLWEHMPTPAWGSEEVVENWIEMHKQAKNRKV